MDKTGSKLNAQTLFFALNTAATDYEKIQQTNLAKKYSRSLQQATKMLSTALKDKDVDTILEFEKIAQGFDVDRSLAPEKRAIEMTTLTAIDDIWTKGKDPNSDYAKKLYNDTYGNAKLKPKKLVDNAMDKAINSRCANLQRMASELTTSADRAFYFKRAECLRMVKAEHSKNINASLGLAVEKGLER